MGKEYEDKTVVSEKAQKGYREFKSTGVEKGKSFKRKSKGRLERESRRYGYRKSSQRVELVHIWKDSSSQEKISEDSQRLSSNWWISFSSRK
jgi:hypothetical protein